VPGSFVGNSTTWNIESRVTTLRVINADPAATRVEHRLPGADGNPYLALAAVIAGGLHGLDRGLTLRPRFSGTDPALDAQGRRDVQYIPSSLDRAVERFAGSADAAGFFGQAFCRAFAEHRRNEVDVVGRQVADWERAWYLESA
jgi:glutamine synthetase